MILDAVVAAALVTLSTAACGDDATGDLDGSTLDGAAAVDASVIDSSTVDAPGIADALVATDTPIVTDASLCPAMGGGLLATTLTDPPYLLAVNATTDVRCAVTGGQPPYSCVIYMGPGEGTVPAGVSVSTDDPSGCILAGGVDPNLGDLPGAYGFVVTVTDQGVDSVDIPVAFAGAPCDTTNGTLMPAASPVVVNSPGSSSSWQLQITDVDGVGNGPCESCLDLGVLTRAPLTIALGLDCAEAGDICSDCAACFAGSCPGPFTMTRDIDLDTHAPLRGAGEPGWVTMETRANYSGATIDPCGAKRWECHVELLEN